MRTKLCIGFLVLAAVMLAGCKRTPVGTKTEEEGAEQKALAEAQAQQTKALEEIRAEIAAWRNTAAAQAAEPEFKDDLAVAKRLAGQLSQQASKQQEQEAAQTVARLSRCLTALAASAPANRIQQHLERVEMALTSGDLAAAGGEVLAAAGTAYNPSAPALVPDVLGPLEEASKAIRSGDAAKAEELLGTVMDKTRSDETSADLAAAQLTAIEAQRCVERKSWQIVIAQVAEIISALNRVEKRSAPEAKPAAASAPAGAESATPSEPTPSAEPRPPPTKSTETGSTASSGQGASAADRKQR